MEYRIRPGGRRSIRLKNFDYTREGFYYVTICVDYFQRILGEVKSGIMIHNELGEIVERCWLDIPRRFPFVRLDEHVTMPNHFHGIIELQDHTPRISTESVGYIVGFFKFHSTKLINQVSGIPGKRIWERNFFEHIVRSECQLNRIRRYIRDNPANWNYDADNPEYAADESHLPYEWDVESLDYVRK